jgi:tetratricopeptide (TPR) repeat protein
MNALIPLFTLTFALLSILVPAHAADNCTFGQDSSNASVYLADAHAMVARQNWSGVLTVTDEAIALYPANADFRCINGYSLRKLGRYQEGVDQTSLAIVLDPRPIRYANRGYSYLALGNTTAALTDAETGISLNPSYPTTYAIQALALHAMGRDVDALNSINRAIAIAPDNAHYWHVKGRILAADRNCTVAQEALQQSLILDPDYDKPWPGFGSAGEDLALLVSGCLTSPVAA